MNMSIQPLLLLAVVGRTINIHVYKQSQIGFRITSDEAKA